MNNFLAPKLPIPPRLMISEEGSFAAYTFTNRLPVIIERVIAENNFTPSIVDKLEALTQDLIVRPIEDEGLDIEAWANYVRPFLGQRLIDTPFYFAETYYYRLILESIEYFSSKISEKIDPFALQKRLGLEKVIDAIRNASAELKKINSLSADRNDNWKQALRNLLYLNLWGNRIDLSLRPTRAGELDLQKLEIDCEQSRVILDDTILLTEKISTWDRVRIDFIVDNAGFELVSDLLIVDFLLTNKVAEVVYIHLKSHPIFVSDATIEDVHCTLVFLANDSELEVKKLVNRLQNYVASGHLRLVDDLFWTAPLFFWEMPDLLRQELSQSNLVFIKGDANYRRLIGDCHWLKSSSFNDIVCYFPSAFTILRTLKSEVIVGLTSDRVKDLYSQDSQWLTNGKWGLIQCAE